MGVIEHFERGQVEFYEFQFPSRSFISHCFGSDSGERRLSTHSTLFSDSFTRPRDSLNIDGDFDGSSNLEIKLSLVKWNCSSYLPNSRRRLQSLAEGYFRARLFISLLFTFSVRKQGVVQIRPPLFVWGVDRLL